MSLKNNPQNLTSAHLDLLAAKGIGAHGNKEVEAALIMTAIRNIAEGESTDILSGVLLASLKILELTESECKGFEDAVEKHKATLGASFLKIVHEKLSDSGVEGLCKKLSLKEELSKSECENFTEYLVAENSDDIYVGYILQALRLKRETVAENVYLKNAMEKNMNVSKWDGGPLIQIAEPFDGFVRTPYLGVYLATILSYLGYPVVLHSQLGLGPKYGVTCLDGFAELQEDKCNSEFAVETLGQCGVAIVNSELPMSAHIKLRDIRNKMIKRGYLATIDKLMFPVSSVSRNIQVCGYVHTPYLNTLSEVFKHEENKTSILIKGVEGGVVIDPNKKMIVNVIKESECEAFNVSALQESVSMDKKSPCKPENILRGQHYFSDHIATTASVIISVAESRLTCEESLVKIKSLFKTDELLKQYQRITDSFKATFRDVDTKA